MTYFRISFKWTCLSPNPPLQNEIFVSNTTNSTNRTEPFPFENDQEILGSGIENDVQDVLQSQNISRSVEEVVVSVCYYWLIVGILPLLLSLVTTTGNMFVMVAIVTNKKIAKKLTSILILNLAIADLLMGVIVMPLAMVMIITNGQWVFGRMMCRIWISLDVICSTASIVTLCVISVDRFVGVMYPLRYQLLMTRRRLLLCSVFVWVFSSSVLIATINYHRKPSMPTKCDVGNELRYVPQSVILSFFVPLAIILGVYGKIYGITRRRERGLRQNKTYNDRMDRLMTRRNATVLSPIASHTEANSNSQTHSPSPTNTMGNPVRTTPSPVPPSISIVATENTSGIEDAESNHIECKSRKSPLLQADGLRERLSFFGPSTRKKWEGRKKDTTYVTAKHNKYSSPSKSVELSSSKRSSGVVLSTHTFPLARLSSNNECVDDVVECQSPSGSHLLQLPSQDKEKSYLTRQASKLSLHAKFNRTRAKSVVETSLSSEERLPKPTPATIPTLRVHYGGDSASRQRKQFQSHKKSAKTLGLVVGAFLGCWFPFFTLYLIDHFFKNCIPTTVLTIFAWVGYSNSAINPIIYAVLVNAFREAFGDLINKSLGICSFPFKGKSSRRRPSANQRGVLRASFMLARNHSVVESNAKNYRNHPRLHSHNSMDSNDSHQDPNSAGWMEYLQWHLNRIMTRGIRGSNQTDSSNQSTSDPTRSQYCSTLDTSSCQRKSTVGKSTAESEIETLSPKLSPNFHSSPIPLLDSGEEGSRRPSRIGGRRFTRPRIFRKPKLSLRTGLFYRSRSPSRLASFLANHSRSNSSAVSTHSDEDERESLNSAGKFKLANISEFAGSSEDDDSSSPELNRPTIHSRQLESEEAEVLNTMSMKLYTVLIDAKVSEV